MHEITKIRLVWIIGNAELSRYQRRYSYNDEDKPCRRNAVEQRFDEAVDGTHWLYRKYYKIRKYQLIRSLYFKRKNKYIKLINGIRKRRNADNNNGSTKYQHAYFRIQDGNNEPANHKVIQLSGDKVITDINVPKFISKKKQRQVKSCLRRNCIACFLLLL